MLAACIVWLASAPMALAQQDEKQGTQSKGSAPSKTGSKLVLGKAAVSREHSINFPMEFTAGPGETVGMIHAQISLPGSAWKFLKAEPASGSRLKISAKRVKRGSGQGEQALDLTISAGTHVIKDGVIGTLQFSVPQQQTAPPEPPVARILATAPPETEQVTTPSEAPFELPPQPPANPGVACFFFSH